MSNLDPIPDHAIVAQALRHGELHKALLDHFDEGVYMVDRERRILYWNAGAERITGYLAHEVAGHFCHGNLMMHCDAGGSVLCGKACPLSATMLDGRPRECTVFLRHKHGYRLPVYVRARPIYDSVGMLVGAVEVFEEWRPRAARNCTHYVVKYDLTGEVAKTPSPEHPAPAAKHDPAPQKSGHS
jgi:PAS domain S-box-containing protein